MIPVKPDKYNSFTCPKCKGTNNRNEDVIFLGKYTLAKCSCQLCFTPFYHTYPVGHSQLFPVAFSSDQKHVLYKKEAAWWAKPLLKSFSRKKFINPNIEIIQYQAYEKVVLLICLDDCFGHSFTKLLNAQHLLKNREIGVVVVVQKSFQWLLPKGIAEAWLVDVKTKDLNRLIGNCDDFIKTEIRRFDTVFLHGTYMPPDFFSIDYEKFTKTKRFDLNSYIYIPPVITFICREDRTWTNSSIEYFFYLFFKKFRIYSIARRYFAKRQNELFSKTANLIHQEINDTNFYVTGFDKSGGIAPIIKDLRITGTPKEEIERSWCSIYSQSHLVIGVHGSNMLIPTSLSAGFINILPSHKINNYGEDVSINYKNKYLLYLCRHLSHYTPPKVVARHAISMITRFKNQIIQQ